MKIGLVPQVIVNALHPSNSVPYVPLGLLSLAGALDRRRHTVDIVDLTAAVKDGRIPYDRDFESAAARLIHSRGFDLVGFSTFSAGYHHTLKIVQALKARAPSTLCVLGGPQASFCDEETLASFPVDLIVRGEGEWTFEELLEALEDDRGLDPIQGLSFRRGERILRTPDRPLVQDLDTLALPAFDLYPLKHHPKAAVEATRGCPYHCVYCATSNYWGHRVRHKSIDRIYSEMVLLSDTYDVEYISFADDTFTINRKWTLAFCRHLVARGYRKPWLCSTRIDAVDDELLAAMAQAGCGHIFYGIESGSERVQKAIRKNIRIGRVVDNLRKTASQGISVTASLMMGFPDETEEDLKQTLQLRNRIQLIFPYKQAIQIHVLSPDVNTQITLENQDRLRYDGFHSDGSGGELARYDREMILAHRDLFMAYYYIEMTHLDREFVKLVHTFLSTAQVICYWSSLYVMLRDGDPLRMAKRWIEAYRSHPVSGDVSPEAPLLLRAVPSATRFFASLFRMGGDVPAPVSELYQHEFEMMRIKGGLAIDTAIRQKAAEHRAFSHRQFAYDPRETIALIREDYRKVRTQRLKPTRIDYVPRRRPQTGRRG
ncbi:MAG: B12-binding domain-containing radical SAM protein [Deltaproteobacteria bacterium]|nr:B12-binding domain-containing radical SAM protein [Deltaproteobacteria bacterium]